MTDFATTTTSGFDPFWQRVRQAIMGMRLNRQRDTRKTPQPATGRGLNARIEEELRAAWLQSAGRNVSLSVLVVELDLVPEFFSVYGRAAADDCIAAAMQAIGDVLTRPEDRAMRLAGAAFVIAMPDYPVLMARSIAQQIVAAMREEGIAHKESHAGVVTASVGVAVVNPVDEYNGAFFDAAAEALKKAQRRGLGRVEVVDVRPVQELRAA